jgi:hypothetical protein
MREEGRGPHKVGRVHPPSDFKLRASVVKRCFLRSFFYLLFSCDAEFKVVNVEVTFGERFF